MKLDTVMGTTPLVIGHQGGGPAGCTTLAADAKRLVLGLRACLTRRTRACGSVLALAMAGTGCAGFVEPSGNTAAREADDLQVYAGLGLGVSRFDIEVEGAGFEVDSEGDTSAQLTLGARQGSFAVEARVADLGEATFQNTTDKLGFQVADVTGLASLRGHAIEPFLRLGLGALFDSGDIDTEVRNRFHLLLGGGLEVPIGRRWSLRAEVSTHDVDATQASLNVLYRFGATSEPARQVQPAIESSDGSPASELQDRGQESQADATAGSADVDPAPVPAPAPTADAGSGVADSNRVSDSNAAPATEPEPESAPASGERDLQAAPEAGIDSPTSEIATQQEPEPAAPLSDSADKDDDGVADSQDQCVATLPDTRVDDQGCLLFGGPVAGITFVDASDQLRSSSETVLQQVLAVLDADDAVNLAVASHAFDFPDAEANLLLSRRRTLAVIRWLTDRGIAVSRVTPEAFGSSMPLVDSPEGDRATGSNRLELFLR